MKKTDYIDRFTSSGLAYEYYDRDNFSCKDINRPYREAVSIVEAEAEERASLAFDTLETNVNAPTYSPENPTMAKIMAIEETMAEIAKEIGTIQDENVREVRRWLEHTAENLYCQFDLIQELDDLEPRYEELAFQFDS